MIIPMLAFIGIKSGSGPHVKIFDPSSYHLMKEFRAYHPSFRNDIFVAAGDFLSDDKREIITGAGPSGGPAICILDSQTGQSRAASLPMMLPLLVVCLLP